MEKRKRNKREMKKKIWLIGLIILMVGLCGNLSFAYDGDFKHGSEPDGFRGIKWGTDISTLSDMEDIGIDPSSGRVKGHTRKNEDLHIGGAELESIEYGFWKRKFSHVSVYTKGSINWYGLKDAVFEKFGKGYQKNKDIEYYVWGGKITEMLLEYNEVSKEGELWMFSGEFCKQQKAYKKQKAKEGAEKGF